MIAGIPVIGCIGAGFPKASEGYEDEPLDIHDVLIRHPAATFYFRLTGNALRDEGLPSGAVLVVDRSIVPVPGRLAVVEQEGVFMVRRLGANETTIIYGIVVGSIVRC